MTISTFPLFCALSRPSIPAIAMASLSIHVQKDKIV